MPRENLSELIVAAPQKLRAAFKAKLYSSSSVIEDPNLCSFNSACSASIKAQYFPLDMEPKNSLASTSRDVEFQLGFVATVGWKKVK
jgi:hypothetical protein